MILHCSGHKIILQCTITDSNTVLQQYAWGRYRCPYFKEDVPNNLRVYAFGKTLGRKCTSSLCKASRYSWCEFCSFEGKRRLLRSRTEEQSVGIVGIYVLAIRTCRSYQNWSSVEHNRCGLKTMFALKMFLLWTFLTCDLRFLSFEKNTLTIYRTLTECISRCQVIFIWICSLSVEWEVRRRLSGGSFFPSFWKLEECSDGQDLEFFFV